MSRRQWLRRWHHRRRWKKAERNEQGPLREFVYLDEVSVYSLVASQVGLIVTELTETQASSLQSEVSSGIGVSVPFKAEVGSKLQAAESQSSQVLRKAIIQTTFKQLYETATRSGALQLGVTDNEAPAIASLIDMVRFAEDERRSSCWVVTPERLRRGDLIEMDVQLEAEPIFQAGAVISGVLEVIQDDPAAFGLRDTGELAQVRLISRIVEKLLAGLVPVRGRSLTYEVVESGGHEWLVHKSILAQLPERPVTTPVYLVGVAQQGLFWKDVRRVLFSGSSYRLLARLNRGGLQHSWTPVKLVDVLRDVVPDFAEVMETMNRGVLSAMSSAVAAQRSNSPADRVRAATTAYATLLAERVGEDVTEDELVRAGLFTHDFGDTELSVREWRQLLGPVTKFIEERTGCTFDREVASDYRIAAITQAGLLDPALSITTFGTESDRPPERFLDSEIVAVYW